MRFISVPLCALVLAYLVVAVPHPDRSVERDVDWIRDPPYKRDGAYIPAADYKRDGAWVHDNDWKRDAN